MCDTFRPLHPTKAALEMDDPKYPQSWADWKPQADGDNGDEKTPNTW